jgi:hypothetical protein
MGKMLNDPRIAPKEGGVYSENGLVAAITAAKFLQDPSVIEFKAWWRTELKKAQKDNGALESKWLIRNRVFIRLIDWKPIVPMGRSRRKSP